jgi:hypothetical protein
MMPFVSLVRGWLYSLVLFMCAATGLMAGQQSGLSSPISCHANLTTASGDSLFSISSAFFGDPQFDWAILLATNSHSAEPGFSYIADRDHLQPGTRICVPARPDTERLRYNFDLYRRAVQVSAQPSAESVSSSLRVIADPRPLRVVTWESAYSMAKLKKSSQEWNTEAPFDIWVTVVPDIRNFCRAFLQAHSTGAMQLDARLEERLGLPPQNGKIAFVEITVPDPSNPKHFFRPCRSPSVSTAACTPGMPDAGDDKSKSDSAGQKKTAKQADDQAWYKTWFLAQYYSSFAGAPSTQYPWTSLGYTFDWSLRDDGKNGFVKYGESEFVIPKGAPIKVESVTATDQYCKF